jgi:hypothetical protein
MADYDVNDNIIVNCNLSNKKKPNNVCGVIRETTSNSVVFVPVGKKQENTIE